MIHVLSQAVVTSLLILPNNFAKYLLYFLYAHFYMQVIFHCTKTNQNDVVVIKTCEKVLPSSFDLL